MNYKTPISKLNIGSAKAPESPARLRLAKAFVQLQHIDMARTEWEDPHFAKPIEERIVWSELLELELQDVDERIEKIAAGIDSCLSGRAKP